MLGAEGHREGGPWHREPPASQGALPSKSKDGEEISRWEYSLDSAFHRCGLVSLASDGA